MTVSPERATTMPSRHRERPCRGIHRMTSTGSRPDLESAEVDNEAVWQSAVSCGGREPRRALATWDSSTRRAPTEERWLHAIDASKHFTDVCSCRAVAYDDWLRFLNRAPRQIWNRRQSVYNFRCVGRCHRRAQTNDIVPPLVPMISWSALRVRNAVALILKRSILRASEKLLTSSDLMRQRTSHAMRSLRLVARRAGPVQRFDWHARICLKNSDTTVQNLFDAEAFGAPGRYICVQASVESKFESWPPGINRLSQRDCRQPPMKISITHD